MALIDSIKGREVPKPNKGPQGNIPLNSPNGGFKTEMDDLEKLR